MCGFEHYHSSFWWVFPLVMMLLCILMMLGRRRGMGCCFSPRSAGRFDQNDTPSAKEILDMRFASGEINRDEYEAKREIILGTGMPEQADGEESNAGLS